MSPRGIRSILLCFLSLCLLATGGLSQGYRVGVESSMRKVFIRNDVQSFQGQWRSSASVSLARNEHESIQIVVQPSVDLRSVRVRATSFPDWLNVEIHPVGYVYVASPQEDLGQDYVGWYPDPILTFVDAVDVKAGDYQAFWVTFYAPKNASPGVYAGRLRVEADNAASTNVDVQVTVWDFALPDKPSLPTAMSWMGKSDFERIYSGTPHLSLRREQGDRLILWEDYEFLITGYRLFPDRIYGHGLRYLRQHYDRYGWIDFSNLVPGPIHIREQDGRYYVNNSTVLLDDYMDSYIARLRSEYAKLPAGMQASVYTYLLDEEPLSLYEVAANRVLRRLRNEIPYVRVMVNSFQNKIVWEMDDDYADLFDILVFWEFWPSAETGGGIAQFLKARDYLHSKGKQIWWYITSATPNGLNWHLESRLISTRLLLGAISFKFKPDGFLYWEIGNWTEHGTNENTQPLTLTEGAYCNWDPRTVGLRRNGDSQLIYPGPSSIVPSIRLANFRDGMEDYEYFVLLRDLAERSLESDLVEQAASLLEVPESVVGSYPLDHTYSPNEVLSLRRQVAELIVALSHGRLTEGDTTPPQPPTGVRINR